MVFLCLLKKALKNAKRNYLPLIYVPLVRTSAVFFETASVHYVRRETLSSDFVSETKFSLEGFHIKRILNEVSWNDSTITKG